MGFYVFHTALQWDVAGPFRLRQDAMVEVKKRKKATGVVSWGVQLKKLNPPKDKRDPLLLAATEQLAGLLQETKKDPIETLMAIINVCGLAFAEGVYRETLEVEAKGGMPIRATQEKDVRPKTRGGIFFTLARKKMTLEQQDQVPQWKRRRDAHQRYIEKRKKQATSPVQDEDKAKPPPGKPDQG